MSMQTHDHSLFSEATSVNDMIILTGSPYRVPHSGPA